MEMSTVALSNSDRVEGALKLSFCRCVFTHSNSSPPSSSSTTKFFFRKKSYSKKLTGRKRVSNMADSEVKVATSDSTAGKMIFQPILEDGVFRFDCSENDRDAVFPSLSFINSKSRDVPIMSNKAPLYIPSFVCRLGQQIVKLELPAGTSFYGTGEVSGQLERTGKRVFTWNTDAWGYGPETTSLYQSHPWVLTVLPNGEALGILADTTKRCEIDLRMGCRIQFIAAFSFPVITFGPFPSPTDVWYLYLMQLELFLCLQSGH
ncbi:Detected protein of unknown function [Hibiscus syriacus]|uniref:Glycoside hydrolase family 31 N-terminal domain-containing protein n=1 Tax=Hibiscus syriacus TaxID=106335 RepID=A0A6A2ZUG4_HIBSY|nr:Detected protein of unknown function [Hibiscus syriacus]